MSLEDNFGPELVNELIKVRSKISLLKAEHAKNEEKIDELRAQNANLHTLLAASKKSGICSETLRK